MRKKVLKLAACTLVLAMALSLGACSADSKDKDDKKTTADDRKTNNDTDDNDADDSSTSGKFETMDEYVASEQVQSEMETLKASLEGQGMSIDMRGEGNKLIYSYKYDTLVKQDGMAETLESEAAKKESTFVQTAKLMKTVVSVDNPTVVIEYIDANGEMIFTKEYPAD